MQARRYTNLSLRSVLPRGPDLFPTGLALTLWNVLAAGHIRTDAEEEARRQTGENGRSWSGSWERNENEKRMCKALEEVAAQVGAKNIASGMFFSYPTLLIVLIPLLLIVFVFDMAVGSLQSQSPT